MRVGLGERYQARWFVDGQGTRVSRAVFDSPDKAVGYGRRMAQALRWGIVAAETVFAM
ncbi:MAG: hypothetical protein H6636_06955 [Anaerolineales bacterium]|nr:hypothetical protein [Anaerolineales bacterium]